MTKTILIKIAQSSANASDLRLPLAVCGKRNLLILHRIDSRNPADALLIELHGRAMVSA